MKMHTEKKKRLVEEHNSFIHNSQEVVTVLVSINRRVDNQAIVIYSMEYCSAIKLKALLICLTISNKFKFI